MNLGKPLIDQADAEFYKTLLKLRKKCWRDVFGTTQGCWCFNYYGEGQHYNCNQCSPVTPFDKLPQESTGATATVSQPQQDYGDCCGLMPGPVDTYMDRG